MRSQAAPHPTWLLGCLLGALAQLAAEAEALWPCRYARAIDAFQAQEYLQLACISLLNVAQSALVFVGLALGLVVCVRGIVAGQQTVGDVVLFLSLMAQLVAPLSFFGSYYRQVTRFWHALLPDRPQPKRWPVAFPPPLPQLAPLHLVLPGRSRKVS